MGIICGLEGGASDVRGILVQLRVLMFPILFWYLLIFCSSGILVVVFILDVSLVCKGKKKDVSLVCFLCSVQNHVISGGY